MKISLIQQDIAWEDKQENFVRFEKAIVSDNSGADICILPEMFNTGFSVEPESVAEPPHSITFDWMREMARKKDCALCGSYIVRERKHFFNRLLFMTPGGESFSYNKRHLFSMGGEDKAFTAGRKRTVIDFRGVRILPLICYDLRFPVWSRNRNDYDLLLYSANWPVARKEVWITLLKARAIENQCYVAGANRIGTDATGASYFGGSMIINARGEEISTGDLDSECVVTAEIQTSELDDFREKFPVLKDADLFKII
jgi:omega-amidase